MNRILLTTTSFQDTPGRHHDVLKASGLEVVNARGPINEAGMLDLVVTNPPYVADTDELEASVSAWEPPGALRAGAGGLDALREIVAGARRWLRAGGALVSEIGATQGDAVRALATEAGLTRVEIRRDLAGRDRVLTARAAPV